MCTLYIFCIEVRIRSGALRLVFHLTLLAAHLGWHSRRYWRLPFFVYIRALVTAVLRETTLTLATVGEAG